MARKTKFSTTSRVDPDLSKTLRLHSVARKKLSEAIPSLRRAADLANKAYKLSPKRPASPRMDEVLRGVTSIISAAVDSWNVEDEEMSRMSSELSEARDDASEALRTAIITLKEASVLFEQASKSSDHLSEVRLHRPLRVKELSRIIGLASDKASELLRSLNEKNIRKAVDDAFNNYNTGDDW